ncbi:Hsp33 family molecular chaperone HslO [Stenoxybacter acetivorans]|uniref:Hsp33 family molecular chaperone HslO n=1 Tax=Stenoxybacter acetivorans TaxID=422441 RepID=UPI00055F7C22|nr:Hsp33 family molecular chaperone HslO [Stenoxybacter acetivorans]
MKNESTPEDNRLTRFVFDELPIRGLHVRLTEVWQHINSQKHYPLPIRTALGELTAAAVLLAANLKFDGQLIVQVQGKGMLKMLTAEATSDRTCRATARWDENIRLPENAALTDLLGEDGMFVLTLQPANGESWQGIVPLAGGTVAQMLMNYLHQSEQLDSFIQLAADGQHLGGLLLQKMPDNSINAANADNAWAEIRIPAQTLSRDELLNLDASTILYRLFHEIPPRVFPAQNIEFACTCSRSKVRDMLLLLGGEEVGEAVAEQGSVEICCDFCHERYVFDENDINQLFGMDTAYYAALNKKTAEN